MSESLVRKKKRLGDLLVDAKVITTEQLLDALKMQKEKQQKLGMTLIDMGITTEDQIANALHQQLNLDFIHLSDIRIGEEVLHLVSESVLRKHSLIPFEFSKSNANFLRVAMADPLDIVAIDDISIVTSFQIEPVVATPKDVAAAIDRYYGNVEAMKVAERYTKERKEQYGIREKEEEIQNEDVNNAPIVQLVTKIIEQAVRQRASDIHIEALDNQVRIRYRVDGVLKEVMRYEAELLSAIVARIKIIGGMDISEKRKPQDGRITSIVDRQEFDIRVSILPTVFGEKVVMRLTSNQSLTKNKKELGFFDLELSKFDKILKNPHGIILVTGPTGSGKSTTLYTAISELNVEGVNIVTVEDPVEANIAGINQVQVNPKADLTFATALRSILRQDPDIIMIGEIRDTETAEIAVKASITGHLVVSTLHTNSAASTITRLADMGVEPYLIADSTVGVIAQRLIRKLCPKCKRSRLSVSMERRLLNVDEKEEIMIYEANPTGCHHCNNTGYYGRTGIYEIMPITVALKEAISRKASTEEIKAIALQEGMQTLRMSATKYVLDGTTTIEEMKKVSFDI
jgi:type IV pilus assembly protein PilB